MKKITSFLAAGSVAFALCFGSISVGAAAEDISPYNVQEIQAEEQLQEQPVVVQQDFLAEPEPAAEAENSTEETNEKNIVNILLISLAVGAVIALIVCLIMKSMMKTANPKLTANDYIRKNSFNITRSRDIFIYANVTKKKRVKEENK